MSKVDDFIQKYGFSIDSSQGYAWVIDADDVRTLISELVPEGSVVVPVEPKITSDMKADHIGEYTFSEERYCCEDEECSNCGGAGRHMAELTVPWDLCKTIFKAMYKTAIKESLSGVEGGE